MVPAERLLPDTCAWIDFFNGRSTPLALALEHALQHNSVCSCGVVQYELIQGLRHRNEEQALFEAMQAVDYLELSESLWVEAGRLSASLRKKGVTVPFSDILIATLARTHNAALLTVDRHFELIEGLRIVSE